MTPRLCRICHERHVPPGAMRRHDYRCTRCRHQAPSHQRAERVYEQSEKRRLKGSITNLRRIFIGHEYAGRAETAALAATINAHIRGRLRAFKRQQTGA